MTYQEYREQQTKKDREEIENGKKYGFTIYLEGGDKHHTDRMTKEEAQTLKAKLNGNNEVYDTWEAEMDEYGSINVESTYL